MASRVKEIFDLLYDFFGPQHWWPGETPFEIMVGAVLVQNTNWSNVEKAINNLKRSGLLSFDIMEAMPPEQLAEIIRPCGYFNLKTQRLHNLFSLIRNRYEGEVDFLLAEDQYAMREALLSVKGIGPETADSIVLYAGQKPAFVVDAYTHRVMSRHALVDEEEASYEAIQEMFVCSLPEDTKLFNEYHALLVRVGKEFCKKSKPQCEGCPLKDC